MLSVVDISARGSDKASDHQGIVLRSTQRGVSGPGHFRDRTITCLPIPLSQQQRDSVFDSKHSHPHFIHRNLNPMSIITAVFVPSKLSISLSITQLYEFEFLTTYLLFYLGPKPQSATDKYHRYNR